MVAKMEEPILHVRGWVNGREIVLPYDRQSLSPQSPAGEGSRLGNMFGSRISAINCAPE